jgi:hypothetical protein
LPDKLFSNPPNSPLRTYSPDLFAEKLEGFSFVSRARWRKAIRVFMAWPKYDEKAIIPYEPYGTVAMPPNKEVCKGILGNLRGIHLKKSIEGLLVLNLDGFEIVQPKFTLKCFDAS